jgi:hypothetical protein
VKRLDHVDVKKGTAMLEALTAIAAAATLVIIAACGGSSGNSVPAGKAPAGTAPPAPASASSAPSPPNFAAYARTWAGHDERLVIHANGQFLLTVWNAGFPASSSGQLSSVSGGDAVGEVTQTTAQAPAPKGRIVISLDTQTDSVTVNAVRFGSATVNAVSFCGPYAPPSYCGA